MKPLINLKNNENYKLAESPIYCEKSNELYWVDIIDKKLYFWNDNITNPVFYNFNTRPTSIGLTTQPDILFITLENSVGFFDKRNGKIENVLSKIPSLNQGYRLNDGKVSPDGRSYLVGSMCEKGEPNKGQFFDISLDQSVIIRNVNTHISNGICWDKKQNLFYANSTEKKIYRVSWDGIIDEMEWEIEGEPDGSCMDRNGFMYNAEYDDSKISIYNTNTLKKEGEIMMPCKRPTCPTWGGKDRNILFCSSAMDINGKGGEIYYERMEVDGELTNRLIMPIWRK